MSKIKVLFLSANPAGTTQLQLDEEIRQITLKIRASEFRDSLEIVPRFAARADDLLQALLEHKPHVVHFSGHGSRAGELIVVDDSGKSKPIGQSALTHLFATLRDNIRVVLLNACHSRDQAEAIAASIDCTIGMNKAIGDSAAIVFAASFYRAIGFGRTIKESFDIGKTAILLEGIPEGDTPELIMRGDVDPSSIRLVTAGVDKAPKNHIFETMWANFDEDLQDAFALAAAAALRDNEDYISTSGLFSALLRLNPKPLPALFSQLPEGAIKDKIGGDVEPDVSALTGIRSLSPCVTKSLQHLSPLATPDHKLASEDIFVDIARHGTGKSTRRLRSHGVDRNRIDSIVKQLGWVVAERV